ncbi:hypothetical protein HK104_009143 [Borealophlyctis nickersoniae]|nr:hypothetical protein HK104_009143 [Borealophlyctis nickersoniae]
MSNAPGQKEVNEETMADMHERSSLDDEDNTAATSSILSWSRRGRNGHPSVRGRRKRENVENNGIHKGLKKADKGSPRSSLASESFQGRIIPDLAPTEEIGCAVAHADAMDEIHAPSPIKSVMSGVAESSLFGQPDVSVLEFTF